MNKHLKLNHLLALFLSLMIMDKKIMNKKIMQEVEIAEEIKEVEEVEVVEVVVDNRVNKIAVAKELDLQSIPKTSQKNHFIQEKKVIIVSVLHQTKADKVILVVGRYINIKEYLINKKSNAWRMKLTSNNKLSKY